MAQILSDKEIEKLIGSVLVDGDAEYIHPNSYILRLGSTGEFLNSGKEYSLGTKKKGIRIQPSHSVAVTAFETIDFSRDTVHKIFPDHDLHGFISPTTDLSREGIVAPATQIDAGYKGTLNWTITNTSSTERRYLYQEKIFRLTIFKLGEGETPDDVYHGDYQEQVGYVRSTRKGAPVGMKDSEWENSKIDGGPEEALENLIKSGYPWNMLGKKLAAIDAQFLDVTNEYKEIHKSINNLKDEMKGIRIKQNGIVSEFEKTINKLIPNLQNRWLIGTGSMIVLFGSLFLTAINTETVKLFLNKYGSIVGLVLTVISLFTLFFFSKKERK